MVALGLLVVVMTASLPAFLAMLRSTVTTKLETQGKNLTQERLEQMRDLRYHVDRQNGPFLDVLDVYYTNAKLASPVTSVTASGSTLTGQFVGGTAAATATMPAAPYYKTSTGPISGNTKFSQVIVAQFLAPNGSAIPSSRFQDVYDSQTVGKDQPPSLMLGVTITTSWTDAGKNKSYKAYTRITDGRPQLPIIQSQARAVAVDITSTGYDGGTLELQAGVANADGAQSSGSSVSGYVTGALATRTGQSPVTGELTQFALPATAASTTGSTSAQDGGSCSWYAFGSTANTNANGNVSSGLPLAPANAAATPPNVMSGAIMTNGGGSCGLLAYDNTVNGGSPRPATDALGFEMGAKPFVRMADVTGAPAAAVKGSSYVMSNSLTSTPQKTQSGAAAAMTQQLVLFPNNPESTGPGLVSVKLTSASVDCVSGSSTVDGTVVGKYDLTLSWWGRGPSDSAARMHSARWTYDSSVSATPVLAAGSDTWDPANTSLGNSKKLSELVTSPVAGFAPSTVAASAAGQTSGLRGFTNPILSLTTASTLLNESSPGFSSIRVQFGQLTCVADDQR